MFKKLIPDIPEGRPARWISVRFKMLGIFSIMLALIVLFQAVNYFLTLRSVQDLKAFYGHTLERSDALGLKNLFLEKRLALNNYALFPDESHKAQLMYTDKVFMKEIERLSTRSQRPDTYLLDNLKTRNISHDAEITRLLDMPNAIASNIGRVETMEASMLSDIYSMHALSVLTSDGTGRRRLDLIGRAVSYFNPVKGIGMDIRQEAEELSDYLIIKSLATQQSAASRRFLLTGDGRYAAEFNKCNAELENFLDQEILLPRKKNDSVAASFKNAKNSNEMISASFKKAVLSYRSGGRGKAVEAVFSSFMDEEMLASSLGDLIDKEKADVNSAFSALTPIMTYTVASSRNMLMYIMVIAALMAAIIYATVSRMVRPIINLDDAARKIALGDWTQRVGVRSRDEIGRMARSFNKMTDNLEAAEKEILKNQLELSALYDVSRTIGRTIDLGQLLKEILETITRIEVFKLERKGAIFIVEGERMNIASSIGESPAFAQCRELKTGECLCGLAATRGEIITSTDSTVDKNHATHLPNVHSHGHIIVPLKAMDKVVGVLCLYLPQGVIVDEDKKTLLYILGAQIGIAIENAKLYEETKSLSLRDSLTGLANRRLMDIMLEKSFARAQRMGSPFSCIMLDIDFFKKYNDAFGHPAGDRLLKRIAEILLNEVRAIDLVVRYGGEEFFVLLPDAGSTEALKAAERIRIAVEAGSDVTVSLGAATYHRGVKTVDDLIKKADEALYQAKQNGRNRVESSSMPIHRAAG